jgi:hypothetical protein
MTAARISLDLPIFLIDSNRDRQLLFSFASSPGRASARIRYAAGRASRSVSSRMSTAILIRADECRRL